MAYPYIAKVDIVNRLSPQVVQQIYDDQETGSAADAAVSALCADASSKVAGYLRGIYDLDDVANNPPHEVIRLSLDVATAYASQRFPSYVKRDWEKLMKQAEGDLDKLRMGKTRLDVKLTPEPAANEGGLVVSGDINNPDTKDLLFTNGTGIF